MILIKKIYFKFNNHKLEKAKMKLRKISIERIEFILERQCKSLNIQYKILSKDRSKIIFKLKIKNKNIILKFHKSLAVALSDYNKFMAMFTEENGDRGYYITTGVFHHDIHSKNYLEILRKKIDIIDGQKFLLSQKWFNLFNNNHFIYKNICFKKYLRF